MNHRKSFTALVWLLLICGYLPAAELQPVLYEDRSTVCHFIEKKPVIDGKLDDACWDISPSAGKFVLLGREEPAKEQTHVFLAYDSNCLYAGFRCFEPEMEKLAITGTEKVWRDDSVEILIDPDRNRKDYFQFIASVGGSGLQMINGTAGSSPDMSWNASWTFAAAKGDREWTLEVSIPWSSINIKPHQGLLLRANFARNEQGKMERSSWTPRTGGICNALHFGNVVLGNRSSDLDGALEFGEEFSRINPKIHAVLTNKSFDSRSIRPSVYIFPGREISRIPLSKADVGPKKTVRISARLPLPEACDFGLELWAEDGSSGKKIFLNSYRASLPPEPRPVQGGVLSRESWGSVWEASVMSKVMPDDPEPKQSRKLVEVYLAKNEFEPFQLVITPKSGLKNVRVRVSGLPEKLPVSSRVVGRVRVEQPTSPECLPGDYPDPLLPFEQTDIPTGRNTALWFTVRSAGDVPAGDYNGTVTIEADGVKPVVVPLKVHVWNFRLPELSNLRTAYGINMDALYRWHGVTEKRDERRLMELTNRNFFEHRTAPFNPLKGWRIDTERNGEVISADFTEFDEAASKFLPMFNSFNMPGAFMGGVHDKDRGDPGYEETKKQFLKLLAYHLREKGWLDKAYCYIYDEPREQDYEKVVKEASIWREADPDLKILLTEQPEEPLFGSVDIWVPVLDAYNTHTCQSRQEKGDDVWWYVCTGPKHPYPNNFIDYPSLDHRVLHWMNFKYKVTGVLYWQTTFWQKNPWEDPMTMSSKNEPLGNGDGILLYPAVKKPSDRPLIQGPLDSIRWEMIREGIEDYDYLWMLEDAVRKAEAAGHPDKSVKQAKQALALVDVLIRDLADYERDGEKYMNARRKVAEAIERLMSDAVKMQ